jgi:cytosine/adenosine deaminase-related metal-dependent hydrolase
MLGRFRSSHALVVFAVGGCVAAFLACTDNVNDEFPDVPDDLADAGSGNSAPAKPAQPHTNKNPQPKVTECPADIPATGGGICEVVTEGTGARVYRGTVLGPEETFHQGEILVSANGEIACVGCDCSGEPSYASASVIACPEGVISPGLINTHEHLTYQNNRPIGHGEERYENRSDWQGARGHTRLDYESGANSAVQAYGELRFLIGGATSIAGGGGVPGLLRNLDTSPDELEGLPIQVANSDVFPLSTPGKNLSAGCEYSPGRTTMGEVSQLRGYLPHISEGIDLEAHNEFLCTSEGEFDLVQRQTGIIHAVALTPADAQKVQKDMAKVIWSPRSNVDLYGNTAQAVMLDLAGVTIALGTDWVPSGSMNILRELKCADSWNQKYFDKHFTDADLWRMVTINPAFAVGAAHATGMLKVGYLADIAIFDGTKAKDHRAVIDAGVEDVALVLRGGRPMYGDAALFASPTFADTTCLPLGDVCGQAKTVCSDYRNSSGIIDLSLILAEGAEHYPLFFCRGKVPDDEPNCEPSRSKAVKSSGTYTGKPTKEDTDGDGIPDPRDNCPRIFNPVRPMDQGRQADADGDGIGDACDECPDSAEQKCTRAIAGDLDNDGVPNGLDNCPEKSNPDQADGDDDGIGDACDLCPTGVPGAGGCPMAISTIRNHASEGHPPGPTVVEVDGFVTARKSSKFVYMQEDRTGAPWQGILVQTGALTGNASSGIKIGQRIRVRGMWQELFNVDQITAATVTTLVPGTALMIPLPVDASLVNSGAGDAAEPYESLLVRVGSGAPGSVTITNDNPDNYTPGPGRAPFYEFVVTGNLRVDDNIFSYHGTPAPGGTACPDPCPYPPPGFTRNSTFFSITGIMGFSFGNRKLFPRGNSDSTTGGCRGGPPTCADPSDQCCDFAVR